ncbi:MAG: alpha-beta hydrolase superfamily lysophospholipase, partial [Candidatus Paceibacteria bacterium]
MHQEYKLPFKKYSISIMFTQPKEILGVVVVCHGFGEHYGRYVQDV